MSYLGKISAIVSANTSDFQSKLSGAAKDVQRFATSMQGSLTSAQQKASTSLRGIYTEAQKLERALQAVASRKLSFKGFEAANLQQAVDRMQALYSATRRINQPLAEAAAALNRLPDGVQANFLPAMVSAQSAAERLGDTINRTGTASEAEFAALASKVDLVTSSMRRLQDASNMVSQLSRGDSFRFTSPRSFDAFTAAARAQRDTDSIPATILARFGVGEQQAAVAAAAARVRDLEAQRERRMSLGLSTNRVDAVIERETDLLEAQIRVLQRRNEAAQKYALIVRGGFVSSEDLASTANGMERSAARRAAAANAYLPPVLQQDSLMLSMQGARTDVSQRLRDQQEALRRQREADIRRGERELGANLGATSNLEAGRAAERQRLARESLGMNAPGLAEIPRVLAATEGRVNSLSARISALPAPLRQVMLPALAAIQGRFVQLAGAINPAIDQIDRLDQEIQNAETSAKRLAEALRMLNGFGGAGTQGVELGLDQAAASRAEAQMNALQAELSLVSSEARGPAVQAFNAWRNAVSRAMADGTIGTRQMQEELAELRTEAINATAAARGIDPSAIRSQVVRAGSRRQGDIARMGVGNASLAMQQFGFAIDDFMSSTGGVDQRLRAISNNISQMAFILGGTRGLFIGLGVTMAAQAGIALVKWINGGRTAEDQTKALNDALARQKSLVEELAQAFKSFGDSLSRGVFSKTTEEMRGFRKGAEEVMKKRRERSEGRVVDAGIAVNRERATQAMLERQMQQETVLGRMVALRQRLRESQEREQQAVEASKELRAPSGDYVAGVLRRSAAAQMQTGAFSFGRPDEAIRAQAAELMADEINAGTSQEELLRMLRLQFSSIAESQSDYAALGYTDTPIDQAKQELERVIARLENAIRVKGDPAVQAILDSGIAVNRSLTAVQDLIDETIAPFSQTRAEAEKIGDRIEEITKELEKGTTPERDAKLRKEMAALEQQAAQYRSAAEVIRTFADTVKRISTDLVNAVEGETRSFADKARREANQAQAAADVGGEFGPGGERRRRGDAARDAANSTARRDAAEAEARRAQDEADRVREENDRARREFEGRIAGDPQVQAERKRLEELQAIIDSKTATADKKARAADEKARIQRSQQRRFEDSPEGRAAAARADEADRNAATRQEQFRQEDEKLRAGLRGRDIGLTEGQRAAREAKGGLLDIGAARGVGMLNARQAQEQANRFAQEQMRSAAPAIFEMADAVQNAVLQGPSRQALEVTDVSTMEGQRELNRLLRGDDQSKNANIVELEKQNQKLTELVQTMKQVAQNMGIVLDL